MISWFFVEPELINHLDTVDTLAIALIEVVVIAAIFIISVFASNKIAGPMYAFDKVLKQIREGDLSARLHLRPGDIFHSVADEMNETLADLQSRIDNLQQSTRQLDQLECHDREQQRLLKELQEQLKHFTKNLSTEK